MSNWVERQVDAMIDRRIDRYVDKKVDGLLAEQLEPDELSALKTMTRKGQPIDADTEAMIREKVGDDFSAYVKIHNGVARMERFEQSVNRIARILP